MIGLTPAETRAGTNKPRNIYADVILVYLPHMKALSLIHVPSQLSPILSETSRTKLTGAGAGGKNTAETLHTMTFKTPHMCMYTSWTSPGAVTLEL